MDREEAHKLVDLLFDHAAAIPVDGVEELDDSPDGKTPPDKRVVRTKTSGDRVYFLDEVKGTRQWATNPEVVDSLGFSLEDVTEVEEDELLRYQMGPALYKRVDAE